jgi:hypothetical protein
MTRYVEASPRARQWFLLAAIVWLGLALLASRFGVYFPLSGTQSEQLVELDRRTWWAFGGFTVLYLFLSALALFLAAKAVRTKQWPPAGVALPFRARVHEIQSPRKVWLLAIVLICLYFGHIAIAGRQALDSHAMLQEALRLVAPAASKP